MRKFLLVTLYNLTLIGLIAQESQGGNPASIGLDLNKNVPTFTLEALDEEQLIAEDAENGKNGVIQRAALIRETNLGLYNSGVWTELENGDRVWRLVIHADEAKATTLLFEDFFLPKGSKLFLYNPSYTQILGAYTSVNNHESRQFTTELIYGDQCVLEYYEPANQAFKGSFIVEGVAHLYRQIPWQAEVLGFDDSQGCEVNVNCSEGSAWQDIKKGVARIFVVAGSGGGWCTGSLVNNTNQDCTPYFLTAFHCIDGSSSSNFNNYMFYFNYEANGCSTPNSESTITNSSAYFTVNGCSVISSSNDGGSSSSDFALLEFNSDIPSSHTNDVFYNGWNSTNITVVSTNGVSIHHPAGDIKKISTYTQNLTTGGWNGSGLPSHYEVQWAATTNGHGVTEGGSSGSPIFNDLGQIIGTLTGGGSFCTFTSGRDDYGKVSYHWNSNGFANNRRLDIYLDPAGLTASMNGATQPCAATTGLDASVSVILEPSSDICGASFTPQVTLRNAGTNNLTSCQIKYQVTGGPLQLYNWTGNLTSNSTENITLGTINALPGANTFTAYSDNPNGGNDQNTGNDSKAVNFTAIAGQALPLIQNFQASTFPPINYDISNGDSDETWTRTTSAGFNSSASMFVDNWDYNATGAYDWFILPSVDLSNVSNPTLTYDYAYAYYDGNQGTFYDSLAVAYSIDCGSSWFALSFEGGIQLATAGGQSSEFTPNSSEWSNESIDLDITALNGQDNVLIAFVAVNGYGNNIYVDNINIQGGTTTTTPPVANFNASSTSICSGTSVTYTSTSTQNPTSYSWSFPGGNPSSSGQQNPSVTYNNAGTYTATLTVSNAGGSDTETKTNYISVLAAPSLSMSSTPAACNGINTGTASVLATGVGNYIYSWTGSASTSSSASNLAPGSYTVTVTDGNGCSSNGTTTVVANVSVNVQLSVIDSSALGGISSIESTVSGGTPPYTYLWNNGADSDDLTAIGVGSYSLTVTDDNGCSSTVNAAIGGVGIKEPNWLNAISFYPNPTQGQIQINISLRSKQDIRLEVFNSLGQVLYQKELVDFLSSVEMVDLQDASEGVYFIRISSEQAAKLVRFIKKN